ncbi:Tetratricopeptide repeat-containing protein [Halopseudomonas xinjiangensis]|uniref:Tetratricopeptide repeat-containing protein n=1 Tax=Halopseudomonas xinjiangensis TaxID=487184 RepID=A0A1H1NSC0_9GAMM|nr:tetratricopeptide repeat protein [Halopseudomonas xinjiangensis]SDS01675.1 Tetratricopeptide repeat-containing protein [Halopseudomonas xinjiangensis]
MRNSPADRPIRLVQPWTLVAIAGTIGGVLVLTYTGEDMLLPEGREPDAVSANYAELLVAARPEEGNRRVELIELLVYLGEYERARQQLQAWPDPDREEAGYLDLHIAIAQALSATDATRLDEASGRLQTYDSSALSIARQQRLADDALKLGLPLVAADLYRRLADRQPERRAALLEQSATWYLAGNRPAQAAQVYLEMLHAAGDAEQRPALVRRAYDGLVAVGEHAEASRLLVGEMEQLPVNEALSSWLGQGLKVAMGAQRLDLAGRIVEYWRAALPDSEKALDAELRLHLASGNIQSAWHAGERLALLRPRDAALQRQMAWLAEWTGHGPAALDYWQACLALEADPEALAHAWRLAFQLFDYERGIQWLEAAAASTRLSDADLDALIYAHEQRGTPDHAERWLRRYLLRHPTHRLAWSRLGQNLENTQQLQAKAAVFRGMARRFELSPAERVDWASTVWRLHDPEAAWELLEADSDGITDPDYWRTRAALAWTLERPADLQRAYEALAASGTPLLRSEEAELIESYRDPRPEHALEMLVDSWRRWRDASHLVAALELADEQGNVELYRSLIAEGEADPNVADSSRMLLARATLAERDERFDEAERLYRIGLERFPHDYVFHESLLWHLIDRQRVAELPTLLARWNQAAKRVGALWLPFATANQMLQRHEQALAWFRLYLRANADDWLVQAAYADALDAAGRSDQAYRLRGALVQRLDGHALSASPERYAVWLRLLAATNSPLDAQQQAMRWRNGSSAMMQVWFDRLLTQLDLTNQAAQKDQWLAWARRSGLRVNQDNQLQEALRQTSRANLDRLLTDSELDPAQRVAALDRLGHGYSALGVALGSLGTRQPTVVAEQLRRQAAELHERHPQGVSLGWARQDFGGFDREGPQIRLARNLGGNLYASLDLQKARYRSELLEPARLDDELDAVIRLERPLVDGVAEVTLDTSLRETDNRVGLGIRRSWLLGNRDELQLSLDWDRSSVESGMMRAFGKQSGIALAGRHGLSARDQVGWTVRHNRYETIDGQSLGASEAFSTEWTQVQQFSGPTWIVRSGIDYQRARLDSEPLDGLTVAEGGALRLDSVAANTFLDEEFGRVYAGTSIQRGIPGALNRTRAQYTWSLDLLAGWQFINSSFVYGINAGIGIELLGDDELAITGGYQSAPRGSGGEPGGTLGLTYSHRFGR